MGRLALFLLLMPVPLLLAWFALELVPVWSAPVPTWERYPDLAASPGGCEAANVMRLFHAERIDTTADPRLSRSQAAQAAEALIAQQYPEIAMTFVSPPELVRGTFDAESTAWLSLVAFESISPLSRAGAVILVSAQTGSPVALIHLASMQVTEDCGGFAPQPAGLRARLRPFLPLIILAGYAGLVSAGLVIQRARQTLLMKKDVT